MPLQFGLFLPVILAVVPAQPAKTAPSASPEMDAFLTSNQKLFGNNIIALACKDGKMVYKKQVEKETGDFKAKPRCRSVMAVNGSRPHR